MCRNPHHTYFPQCFIYSGNIHSCKFVCLYVKCLVQNTHCAYIITCDMLRKGGIPRKMYIQGIVQIHNTEVNYVVELWVNVPRDRTMICRG